MMTSVISKPLPNAIGSAEIADPTLRRVVTLIMENIKSLHAQLAAVQKAVNEIQARR